FLGSEETLLEKEYRRVFNFFYGFGVGERFQFSFLPGVETFYEEKRLMLSLSGKISMRYYLKEGIKVGVLSFSMIERKAFVFGTEAYLTMLLKENLDILLEYKKSYKQYISASLRFHF